jgi:hypothetical protein
VIASGPEDWQVPNSTAVRARAVIASADSRLVRAYGGLTIGDPFVRLSTAEVGIDEQSGALFMGPTKVSIDPLRIRLASLGADRQGLRAEGLRAGVRVGQFFLLGAEAARVEAKPGHTTAIEGGKLRLFGIKILGFDREAKVRASDGPAADSAGAPEQPRGSSPKILLFRPPRISIMDGNLSFKYQNTLKFAQRYTGQLGLNFGQGQKPLTHVGLYRNLAEVTNETDSVLSPTAIRESSLGSYYWAIREDSFGGENDTLRDRVLLVGAFYANNLLFTDDQGEFHAVDIPLNVSMEAGRALGQVAGLRGQLAVERVEDQTAGADTRLRLLTVVGTRPFAVSRGVETTLKAEGAAWIGDTHYGWLRGTAGLSALVSPRLRLSGAYYQSWESGEPRFAYDRLDADRGAMLRADLGLHKWRLGYIQQYSFERHEAMRHQWSLIRTYGLMDLGTYYDSRDNSYGFKGKVRLDELFEKLSTRRLTGTTAVGGTD